MARPFSTARCLATLALLATMLTSCSSLIHMSGRVMDPDAEGTPRERIRAELGVPVASTDDYDIYTIRRHLPDSGRGLGTAILGVYTC